MCPRPFLFEQSFRRWNLWGTSIFCSPIRLTTTNAFVTDKPSRRRLVMAISNESFMAKISSKLPSCFLFFFFYMHSAATRILSRPCVSCPSIGYRYYPILLLVKYFIFSSLIQKFIPYGLWALEIECVKNQKNLFLSDRRPLYNRIISSRGVDSFLLRSNPHSVFKIIFDFLFGFLLKGINNSYSNWLGSEY